MSGSAKVPPSIAQASREELERLLISSLTKLKSRDKRIEELTKASSKNDQDDQDEKQTLQAKLDEALAHSQSLQSTVKALEDKLMFSEQAFNERLAAETELLSSQLAEVRNDNLKIGSLLASERDNVASLQHTLQSKESLIAQLQDQVEKTIEESNVARVTIQQLEAEAEKQKEDIDTLQSQLSAPIVAQQTDDDQHQVQSLQEKISALNIEMEQLRNELKNEKERADRATATAIAATATANNDSNAMLSATEQAPATPTPSPSKPSSDGPLTPSGSSGNITLNIPEDADAATLRAECERLAKEIVDMKRKFLIATKRKKEEFEGRIKQAEERAMAAENALKSVNTASTPESHQGSNEPQNTTQIIESSSNAELIKAAETAKAEVVQIKKEVEIERNRFKRALAEVKRRTDAIQSEKEVAENAAVQAKATTEAVRAELIAAEQRISSALKDADNAVEELKEYKSRAHALLKSKEGEIREAKASALQEYEEALHAAQQAATEAQTMASHSQKELEELKTKFAGDVAAIQNERDLTVSKLESEAITALDAAAAANRQYEQVKLRYESLETRTRLLQVELETATKAATQLTDLQSTVQAMENDHAQARQGFENALAAKEAELKASQEACLILKEEVSNLKTVVDGLKAAAAARAATNAMHTSFSTEADMFNTTGSVPSSTQAQQPSQPLTSQPTPNEIASITELAKREKDLAAAQRRASQLEREVQDLENEVDLHQAQQTALKEAVRDLEREVQRLKLGAKTIDMEYFKNVMLKLFETGQEESLLPVVSTMLQFSPQELGRCKRALEERTARRQALAQLARGETTPVTSLFSNFLGITNNETSSAPSSGTENV